MSSRKRRLMRGGFRLLHGIVLLAWILAFVFLALPKYRETRSNDRHIFDYESRLEKLGDWSQMGSSSSPLDQEWRTVLEHDYETYFPGERKIENIFYQVAQAAGISGVDPIVVRAPGMGKQQDEMIKFTYFQDEYADDLMAKLNSSGMDSPAKLPGIVPHRLRVSFESNYTELVHFLDELAAIPRALSVNRLSMGQSQAGVSAKLELEYYVHVEK